MYAKWSAVLVVVGLTTVGAASPATADTASDRAIDGYPYTERDESQRLREASERLCQEMMTSAVLLVERAQELRVQLSHVMAQVPGQLTRTMADTLDTLAGRLHDAAQRLEPRADDE